MIKTKQEDMMMLKDYTLEIFKSKCQADAKGAKGPGDCPGIGAEESRKLSDYMSRFNLEF